MTTQTGSKPIAVSIDACARLLGVGRTTTYKLIKEQRLRTAPKFCARTLVLMESIEALISEANYDGGE